MIRRITALSLLAVLFSAPVNARPQDLYRLTEGVFDSHVDYRPVDLEPGKELVLGDIGGPGKITYFYFTDSSNMPIYFPEVAAKHPEIAKTPVMYEGLVLKIYWDDATEPSVRVPLWSFFGSFGHRTIDYQSALTRVNHFIHETYMPMPFAKRGRFVLLNDGDRKYSANAAWGIDYERSAEFEKEASRLHAAWSRSNLTQNSLHTMLDIKGKGHYIGNFLQVNATYRDWWGEGDTLFDVDGKAIVHTPGTEDEYGSTWGFGDLFAHPYSGYLQKDNGKNRLYKWYVANPVRFQKSLRVQIENQGAVPQNSEAAKKAGAKGNISKQPPRQDDYVSVVFWYQEGAHSAPALAPYAQRTAPSKEASYSSASAQ